MSINAVTMNASTSVEQTKNTKENEVEEKSIFNDKDLALNTVFDGFKDGLKEDVEEALSDPDKLKSAISLGTCFGIASLFTSSYAGGMGILVGGACLVKSALSAKKTLNKMSEELETLKNVQDEKEAKEVLYNIGKDTKDTLKDTAFAAIGVKSGCNGGFLSGFLSTIGTGINDKIYKNKKA